jgi:peroxisomal 2,4-dienoyl-CoA reductase
VYQSPTFSIGNLTFLCSQIKLNMGEVFNPDLFAGKVVFVTGGGSGICKGIAKKFMQLGANSAVMGRRMEVLQTAKAELEAATGR